MAKRYHLMISIAILLLLTSCSMDGLKNEFLGIESYFQGLFEQKSEEAELIQEEHIVCETIECLEMAFAACSPASGSYEEGRIIDIEPVDTDSRKKDESCIYTMTVISSDNKDEIGRTLICKEGSPRASIKDTISFNNPACSGTMFELMKPEINQTNADGLRVEGLTVFRNEFIFSLYSEKPVYLKAVHAIGEHFQNCNMEMKNPTRIPARQSMEIKISCIDIKSSSSRVWGELLVEYYTSAPFESKKEMLASFIAVRNV